MSGTQKKTDEEFCVQFNLNALRAQFSLDCLNTALDEKQAIYPEVLEELVDGLRAIVNAYTWARRGLELRVPSEEPMFQGAAMEDEDMALMDLSFSQASEILDDERGMDVIK